MKKFKLPRKLKKHLKKCLWLYPPDEKDNSLMAWPSKYKEDYLSYKRGELRKLGIRNKAERKEYRKKMDKEIEVSDETLKRYVDDIMAKQYRQSSYDVLIKAKNSKRSITAYYNFINAYQLNENGEGSYGNTCCLAIDWAKELLKKK